LSRYGIYLLTHTQHIEKIYPDVAERVERLTEQFLAQQQ
jgi:hypothetical protein